MKEQFSGKLQTEKLCFWLRWRLNKTNNVQIRNMMQYSNTFIRISGPISEVKKICIDQWLGSAYWQKSEGGDALTNNFYLLQLKVNGLGRVTTPGTFCFFPLIETWKQYFQHLNWHKTVIQVCLFFSWKLATQSQVGSPILLIN